MTRPGTLPIRTAISPAAGLALALAGWFAVTTTLAQGLGLFEARFLAQQAAFVVAALSLGLTASTVVGHRSRSTGLFLLASTLPFLLLIGLPFGLRSLAAATLQIPVAVALWLLWCSYHHDGARYSLQSRIGQRHSLRDFGTVTTALALPFLLEPIGVLTGDLGQQLELLGAATALGIAVAWLSRAWGVRALMAGTAVLLFGGLSWFSAVSLLAVAAIETSAPRQSNRAVQSPEAGPTSRWLRPLIAVALIAVACVLSWAGAFLVMAAWAQRARRGWLAAMVVLGALFALSLPSTAWRLVSRDLLVFLLIFPFAATSMLRGEKGANWLRLRLESWHLWRLLTGFALAVVALRTQPSGLALIPAALHWCAPMPAGAANSATSADSEPPTEPRLSVSSADTVAAQATWTAAWLVAVAMGASYPWLRSPALMDQIDEVRRIGGTPSGAVIVLCCLAALVAAFSYASRLDGGARRTTRGWLLLRRLAVSLTLLFSCALVLFGLTPQRQETLHRWPPQVATALEPELEYSMDGTVAHSSSVDVWLDTYLANAAELAPGTEVARITLTNQPGNGTPLLAGQHTAEWSGLASPTERAVRSNQLAPFAYWWTEDEPPRLGQRFRTRISVASSNGGTETPRSPATPEDTTTLRIQRSDALPASVQLRVDRVAIARSAQRP